MALVDDDAIIGIDRENLLVVRRVKQALHHALDGGQVDARVLVGSGILDFLDVIDLGKALEVLQFDAAKCFARLIAQLGAIHQEEDPSKALCADETVEQ